MYGLKENDIMIIENLNDFIKMSGVFFLFFIDNDL